jgi:pimeloyl-ACP methyl ester carboxylesterase
MNTLMLRGLSQLAVDGVRGVSDISERLHAVIAQRATLDFSPARPRTRGITGLVYRSVRGVGSAIGGGLDLFLRTATPEHWQGEGNVAARRLRAVLNGVFGDHLELTGNPLALTMQLRHAGRILAQPDVLPRPLSADARPPRIMVLIHGLCMGPDQWQRQGVDHAAALAHELGFLPLHLEYNSGLPIHRNGAALAGLLDEFVEGLPHRPEQIAIVAHSMGGLVARSACAQATNTHRWPSLLREMVFLGTPHLGAPLERAGSVVDQLLRVSPYSAPFALLGSARSAGIQDLRRGELLPPHWRAGRGKAATRLPDQLRCYAVGASLKSSEGVVARHLLGDGLVTLGSALAEGAPAGRTLPLAEGNRLVLDNAGHFDLLADPRVYAQLRRWLAPAVQRADQPFTSLG